MLTGFRAGDTVEPASHPLELAGLHKACEGDGGQALLGHVARTKQFARARGSAPVARGWVGATGRFSQTAFRC